MTDAASYAPGPFRSVRQALSWAWAVQTSRASPKALDPSRQCIQGSSDGSVCVNGEWHDADGLLARVLGCLRGLESDETAMLAWGYGLRSGGDLKWENEGVDTRRWRARWDSGELPRRLARVMREKRLLKERE